MKFKHQFGGPYKVPGETNTKPSQTLPDQTIPLRKLLENHIRGLPTNATMLQGVYTDMEVPRIDDLTDIPRMRESLKEQKAALQEQVNQELKAAQDKRKQEQEPPKKDDLPKTPPEGGA